MLLVMERTTGIQQTKDTRFKPGRSGLVPGTAAHTKRFRHAANKTIGPHSRAHCLVRVDGRTEEGRYVKRVRAELTEQIGGQPTPAQQLLIERCAWISLRLALLDNKIAGQMSFNLPDTNYYLAWANSLSRMLVKLGLPLSAKSTTDKPTIDEIIAEARGNER